MVRTHVSMFKRREMIDSPVANKVLYAGLIEMPKLDAPGYGAGATQRPHPNLHKSLVAIIRHDGRHPSLSISLVSPAQGPLQLISDIHVTHKGGDWRALVLLMGTWVFRWDT